MPNSSETLMSDDFTPQLYERLLVFFASNPDHGRLTVWDVVHKYDVAIKTAREALAHLLDKGWVDRAQIGSEAAVYTAGPEMKAELGVDETRAG